MTPTEQLDATFIALADPTRRAILARLMEGEASVNELAAPFDISQPAVSKDLFELMNQIARFYESNLKNAPQAVEYLKGRGLTGEVVKRFNIGYAPGDWDQVRRRFGASRDHEQLLISGGMLIPRDSGPGSYDRFRDRIMFPIRDKRGRVIGFSYTARYFGQFLNPVIVYPLSVQLGIHNAFLIVGAVMATGALIAAGWRSSAAPAPVPAAD